MYIKGTTMHTWILPQWQLFVPFFWER